MTKFEYVSSLYAKRAEISAEIARWERVNASGVFDARLDELDAKLDNINKAIRYSERE